MQKNAKTSEHGKGVPEDHGSAVHREKLIVLFGRQETQLGSAELQTKDQGLEAASHQESEGGDDVADADFFVIDA